MGVSATIGSPNCNKRLIPTAYGTRARTPSSISFKARPLESSRIFSNRKHISNQSDDTQGSVPSPDQVDNAGVKVALSLLNFYKREISPLIPRSCRYVPTCSEYSMEAYKKYGFIKGTVLTAWRICRCNPLGGSGFDPPRWFGEEAPPLE